MNQETKDDMPYQKVDISEDIEATTMQRGTNNLTLGHNM